MSEQAVSLHRALRGKVVQAGLRAGLMAALLLSGTAHAALLTKSNSTTGMFDASSGTRLFTVSAGDSGVGQSITKVTISINFAKHDGETLNPPYGTSTPYYNEIVFTLTNPGGSPKTASLIAASSFSNGSAGYFSGTITFDDTAAQVVNYDTSLPHAGTYRSVGSAGSTGLNQFNGLTLAAGDWSLFIQDTAAQDALSFFSATLEITTVPETGLGIALLVVLIGVGISFFLKNQS